MKEDRGFPGVSAGLTEGNKKKPGGRGYRRLLRGDGGAAGIHDSRRAPMYSKSPGTDRGMGLLDSEECSRIVIDISREPQIEGYVVSTLADAIKDMSVEDLESLLERSRWKG